MLEDLVEWEKTCGDDLLQQALIYRHRRDLSREIDHPASLLVECSRVLSSCPEAKFRDGKEALTLAQRACDKPKSDWTALLAKAAAQAELSDFDGALVSLDAAEKSAKTAGEVARKLIAEHRAVFKDKRPFRFVAGGE